MKGSDDVKLKFIEIIIRIVEMKKNMVKNHFIQETGLSLTSYEDSTIHYHFT